MLKKYQILTITYRNTNLTDLAKYVIENSGEDDLQEKLIRMRDQFDLPELLYLATCNRVMYFFPSDKKVDVSAFFQAVNPKLNQEEIQALPSLVNYYRGKEALRHLYEVAASIDSLVVGEREVLRQLRQAYSQCKEWGLTADDLRLAINFAVQNAKEIYAQTRIGEKPISIVSLAIQKLLRSDLPKDSRILMIGAGQTNNLVTKFLAKHGYNNVTVFNRTLQRAKDVASLVNGEARSLAELNDYSKGFDCMIVCTAATQALIQKPLYSQLLKGESPKKLVIDLAIPNNVAREVVNDFPMQYIEIEDLRQLAKTNLAFREKEVEKGKVIIDRNLNNFHHIYQERQIERAMKKVPDQIKAVKSHAMNSVFKKELETLDENTVELLERMLTYMEKRCISIPMQAAKKTLG